MRYILVLLSFIIAKSATAVDISIENRCDQLAKKHISHFQEKYKEDYTLIKTESFYSEKVDSCILIEKKLVGVSLHIRDLSKSIILDGGKNFNVLLHCDVDGADSVVLDKVRLLKGRVWNVSFKEWLDDGFGGLPRALKTPEKPYTKKDCELVLQKWISILK